MLWFVVNTDLTITTEKLVELFATMDYLYMDELLLPLGNEALDYRLDLPRPKVAEIQRNYHSPSQRREAYFDLYATDHPCPSWRQVVAVLCDVRLPHQARVVENTYVQGTMIILILILCPLLSQDVLVIYSIVLCYR